MTQTPKKNLINGFTLIELLVVMAMTAIIATITLTNYRSGEKQKKVSLAGDTIISALSLAQTYALSGKQIADSTCPQGNAPQAYLVNFTTAQVINVWGLDKCNATDPTHYPAILIESFTYPTNVRVQASGYKLEGAAVSVLKFKFTPPFGKLTVSTAPGVPEANPSNNFTTASVTVESTDSSASKTITVDGVAGRIGL